MFLYTFGFGVEGRSIIYDGFIIVDLCLFSCNCGGMGFSLFGDANKSVEPGVNKSCVLW